MRKVKIQYRAKAAAHGKVYVEFEENFVLSARGADNFHRLISILYGRAAKIFTKQGRDVLEPSFQINISEIKLTPIEP